MDARLRDGRYALSNGTPSVATAGAICAGLSLAAASVGFEYVSVAAVDAPHSYSGVELPALALPLLAATGMALVLAIAAPAVGRPGLLLGVLLLAGAAAVSVCLLIFVLESAAALVPQSLLPRTVRRVTFELSAGPGLWLAAGGLAWAAAAALPWRPPLGPIGSRRGRIRPSRRAAALVMLAAATAAFGWLRYQPWIEATAAGEDFTFQGWATPWLGPVSLVAFWMLVAGLVAAVLVRGPAGALLAAGAGWLVTFVATLAIAAATTLTWLRLEDRLPTELPDGAVTLEVAAGAWAALGAGAAAAAAAAALIASPLSTAAEEVEWTS